MMILQKSQNWIFAFFELDKEGCLEEAYMYCSKKCIGSRQKGGEFFIQKKCRRLIGQTVAPKRALRIFDPMARFCIYCWLSGREA